MKKLMAVILMLVFVLPTALAFAANAQYVETIITKRIEADETAIQALENGETQARLFPIDNPEAALNLQQQGFTLITPASGMDNLLLNPNTCADGTLNIFTNRKARFAMQFLVPRDEIVANILKGYGIPQYIPWTPQDPDYPFLIGTALKIENLIKTKGIDYGVQLMEEALQELGAVKSDDGFWYYNDQPVTIKFIIRVEDERYDIGNLVADILEERIGIKVERLYKDFAGAINTVYYGDPTACEWQIYTEGWGIGGLTKYDYGNFVWFYSGIWGGLPDVSWGGDYTNETIDEIATRLDTGNYTGEEEFWQLLNQGVWLGFQESVRVFIVATKDIYIAAPGIKGIVQSPKATPWNPYTYAALQYEYGNEVVFSNRYVYKEGWVWNPVGGWADAYSTYAVENAIAFGMGVTSRITDGATGWSPANATTYKVIKNATVPEDAIVYDPYQHKFVTAAEAGIAGETVANEVILNYKMLPKVVFHDGTQMTVADLFSAIFIGFEWGINATAETNGTVPDNLYEKRIAQAFSTMLATFKGIKVINETAVAVYTNYDHFDEGIVASGADVWHSFPLELYAAMALLVENNESIVWHYRSQGDNKTAVHLIDPKQVQQMLELIQQARDNPPSWVQDLINLGLLTLEEWQARVDNLVAFGQEYGHLVIANGPYYLVSYDYANDAVTLKRWAQFPIDPEVIYAELQPKTVTADVQVLPIAPNTAGSIIANLTIEVNGQPAKSEDVIPYVVAINTQTFDAFFLTVECVEPGKFVVKLPQDFEPGIYQLNILIYPAGYSDPFIDTKSVNLQPIQTTTTTQQTTTQTTTQPPQQTTTQPPAEQTTTAQQTTTTAQQEGGIGAGAIVAVIIVVIIIAAAYYFLRK